MKRVLFVTYENPFHATSGDALYTCNIIESIVSSCTLDLVYYDSNKLAPFIPCDKLMLFGHTVCVTFIKKAAFKLVFSRFPGMVKSRRQKNYLSALDHYLRKYRPEIVFINHFRMLFCLDLVKKHSIPVVYISHNVENAISWSAFKYEKVGIQKYVYLLDFIRTYVFERFILRRCDAVTSISEGDRVTLSRLCRTEPALVRPYMSQGSVSGRDIDVFRKMAKSLLVVGSFVWKPKRDNVINLASEFENSALPREGYILNVVGRMKKELEVELLSISNAIRVIPNPVSVHSFYAQSSIALVPEVIGGGLKLKVLEAASYGLAIFAVDGSIAAGDLEPGDHFVRSSTISSMLAKVLASKENLESLYDMSQRCQRFVNYNYSLTMARERIENVLSAL